MERLVKEEDGANFSVITFVAPAVCGHPLFALGQKYHFFLSGLTWFSRLPRSHLFPGIENSPVVFFFTFQGLSRTYEIQ